MIEYRHKSDQPNFRWEHMMISNRTKNRTNIDRVDFTHYDFRVDGVIFNDWSEEFETALDKEFLWNKLNDTN